MEMAEEWRLCADGTDAHNKRREQLLTLTREIVLHNMKHNAEVEACDLLIEIEKLDLLSDYVEEIDHGRVCMYLLRYSRIFLSVFQSVYMQLHSLLQVSFSGKLLLYCQVAHFILSLNFTVLWGFFCCRREFKSFGQHK